MRQELPFRSCLSSKKRPCATTWSCRKKFLGLNYAESKNRALLSIEHLLFAQHCIYCPSAAKQATSGVDKTKNCSALVYYALLFCERLLLSTYYDILVPDPKTLVMYNCVYVCECTLRGISSYMINCGQPVVTCDRP